MTNEEIAREITAALGMAGHSTQEAIVLAILQRRSVPAFEGAAPIDIGQRLIEWAERDGYPFSPEQRRLVGFVLASYPSRPSIDVEKASERIAWSAVVAKWPTKIHVTLPELAKAIANELAKIIKGE